MKFVVAAGALLLGPALPAQVTDRVSCSDSEGDDVVSAGTLRMPGMGAWAVTCSGP